MKTTQVNNYEVPKAQILIYLHEAKFVFWNLDAHKRMESYINPPIFLHTYKQRLTAHGHTESSGDDGNVKKLDYDYSCTTE